MHLEEIKNKVRTTITLEPEVEKDLRKMIGLRKRSKYINDLLKEDLKKKSIQKLNKKIRNFKKIKPVEPSIKTLRKMRKDGRIERLINQNHHEN